MDLAASEGPLNHESNDITSMVVENEDVVEPVVLPPPAKKLRFKEEVNRVAEIVLVLSAMGTMRGGKSPTTVELELMLEARSKLAEMCQEFSPKDIVGRDAIGVVIEDLGLNGKLKDQRLGFRAPRLTISEKVSLGKRKMEEAKKYTAMSAGTGYTSHMSQQTGGAASSLGLSNLDSGTHTVRVIDRSNPQPPSSGVTTGQWPSNEFKMSTSSAPTVGSHYIRDTSGLAQPRGERSQIKSEMLSGASQGPATSANYWNASTWSAQPQPVFTVTPGADNKVPIQSSVRVPDQSFRLFMSQTPPGTFTGTNQPMQGMNYGQTSPFGNSHVEIAKIIHKVLHPRVQKTPSWNPPSREYMNKAMTCQNCQATISEVETVLICDACEKGYHLKCLPANNLKGVPKSEWHCSRCVQLYSGKSFPIKYGRVMRSANMQKMPSTTAGLELPAEKKVGTMDPKVNQPKSMVTMGPGIQNSSGFASEKSNPSASLSHFETAGTNANTDARAVVTASLKENSTSGSSAAPVSCPETANSTATASAAPSSLMNNNGLVSTGCVPADSTGNSSTVPVANTTLSATSNTVVSSVTSVGHRTQAPTGGVTRGKSSQSSGTGNASVGTLGEAVIGTSAETANATEDAALSGTVNASTAGNGEGCKNSSEPKLNVETVNAGTTNENNQESSNPVFESEVPATFRDQPTKTLDTRPDPSVTKSIVVFEENSKPNAEPSIPQDDSTSQTEKSVSEPPAVSSDCISNLDHFQDALQNNVENPLEDERLHKPDEYKSATINEEAYRRL
ncbi:PREDICTED: PHD finger protein At3g20280-like [Tarenaya hassleriana]|uniref:PHD finger protein At3g20280-like n=1 Tax=Tarenaya hassleriana TaxID=28532 RepID=UPI00053C6AC6|nr:PREDICTED: PHD finger protein At3g20280-like [Tarenaya hassleriana]